MLRPDAGTASVFGRDIVREPGAVRRRVSLTGKFASMDSELTGLENLVLLGRPLPGETNPLWAMRITRGPPTIAVSSESSGLRLPFSVAVVPDTAVAGAQAPLDKEVTAA
jgi:hypothetical protein